MCENFLSGVQGFVPLPDFLPESMRLLKIYNTYKSIASNPTNPHRILYIKGFNNFQYIIS